MAGRNYKGYLLLAAAVVVILAAAVALSYPSGGPRISVSPASHDFGRIPQAAVEKTFEVRNAGGGVLEITRISTSCGCTTAEIDMERIAAGGSAVLTVRFDPNAMAEAVKGRAERVVYVRSNDPAQPEVEIGITAFVE